MNEVLRSDPTLIEIDDAFERILAQQSTVSGLETVPLERALGRVVACDIASAIDLPPFDNSAMDGFGLPAEMLDTQPPFRVALRREIRAGNSGSPELCSGEAVRILTGAPVPKGVEAVVVEEGCALISADTVEIRRHAESGANIRRRGEDVRAGAVIIRRRTVIDPRHTAILAASGCQTVPVTRRVRVGVLSTGDELCSQDKSLRAGAIYDANGPMLRALLSGARLELIDLGRHRDDAAYLSGVLREASSSVDAIVSSGGVSGSIGDYLAESVTMAGGEIQRYRLALKPGKPLLAGSIDGISILGLPGNPGSALINFYLFGRPVIDRLCGMKVSRPRGTPGCLKEPVSHRRGRTEFMPARIVGCGEFGMPAVDKITPAGPARLSAITAADGFIEISSESGDVAAGSRVIFHRVNEMFGC